MDISQIGEFLLNILDRYGIFGAVVIALCILVFKFGNKLVEVMAQRVADGKVSLHVSNARKVRKDAIFKINRLLTELMNKLNVDRAAIFEYHNGGYNLTGLPFLHFSLTIQRNRLGVDELSKDFDNVLVSAVPEFVNDIDKNVIHFIPDIKELKQKFPRLYRELSGDGMTSAILCSLEGVNDQIGFLLLAFREPLETSQNKVTKELIRKTQKISTLLDYKNQK